MRSNFIDDIHKPNEEINLLPQHCVQKVESTTTKLLVVFDGSLKSDNGTSLNTSPIQPFPMTRVIYGIVSAAYHSVLASVEVSNRCSVEELAFTMKNDFYVDDYLPGMDSIGAAKERIVLLCQEVSNFGFELRKWASSHSELISSLPEK